MTREELEQAYLDSFYSVFYNGHEYEVILGEYLTAKMNVLYKEESIKTGLILTACNPRSQLCSRAENNQNMRTLSDYLTAQDFIYYAAQGRANKSSWQEESFFIVNMSRDDSELLAIQFNQNAYVWLEQNKPIELIFSAIW